MSYKFKYVVKASSDYEDASLGCCVVEEGIRHANLETRNEALYLDGCDNIKYACSAKGMNERIRLIDSLIIKGLGV
jgi:hypothetical protein|tara:strand:- start:440 stop:667 length:228 start_codon:yes stop_codon:yes gene_type:complete